MQIGKLVQEGAITIKTGPFGTQLKAAEYQETGIPVLNVKNLGYGTVNSAKLDHVGADTVERLRIHLLQQGDIVFGRKGAVDRHAYIDNESDGWMQGSDCIRLRVETDDINPRFLSYYFLTNQHKAFMISMCSHGTTMASLNQKILEQIDFPCLERNYQDKIVEILSKIDEKGRVNQKINENLTEQARAVFQAWFIDYEPFGGEAPSDWYPSTLGQIAEMKTDSWSPAKNPNVVVEHYSIPAFDEQHYPVFEIASGIKSNKYILNSNSVMISKLNPNTKRIWRPLCLSAHPVCSTEFIVYEAKKQEQRDYIYSILDSVPFLNHLCSHTTGSTNSRQRATPKSTLDFTLCLPPDSVIEEFCQIVTPMYDLIASNIVENQSLAKARDSLLPRLMSGELDVSGLDL